MTDVRILATGLGFPEGPVVCADGSIVLTEIRNQRCSRIAADGKVSLFSDCGGGPNGLAFGPDGYLYISVGDEGYVYGRDNAGRWDFNLFAGILRIDPDQRPENLLPTVSSSA